MAAEQKYYWGGGGGRGGVRGCEAANYPREAVRVQRFKIGGKWGGGGGGGEGGAAKAPHFRHPWPNQPQTG